MDGAFFIASVESVSDHILKSFRCASNILDTAQQHTENDFQTVFYKRLPKLLLSVALIRQGLIFCGMPSSYIRFCTLRSGRFPCFQSDGGSSEYKRSSMRRITRKAP